MSSGYRSSTVRGSLLIGATALVVAVNLLLALLAVSGFELVGRGAARGLTVADATAYDTLVSQVTIIGGALHLAIAVCVFAWLSRVVENTPPLTGGTPRRSPHEAIGWWFVPIASFFVPMLIVEDAAIRVRLPGQSDGRQLVRAWWAAYMASNLASVLLIPAIQSSGLDAVRWLLAVRLGIALLTVVAGALLIVIVRRTDDRSSMIAGLLGLTGGTEPQWPAFVFDENRLEDDEEIVDDGDVEIWDEERAEAELLAP